MSTIYNVVDEILQAVEDAAPGAPGVPTRDANDLHLLSAYGRAYRCLRSIRKLAGEGEADDAAILTRSLLSTILRALYLVQPDGFMERQSRRLQLAYSTRREEATALDEMRTLEFPNITEEDVKQARAHKDKLAKFGRIPPDAQLATQLGLDAFYSRVYRSTSDASHFGMRTMLAGFVAQPTSATGAGASIALNFPDEAKAAEVMEFAALTFAAFLEASESIVRHGLTERVRETIVAWTTAERSST